MVDIQFTSEFEHWLAGLRDRAARGRILGRIERMRLGNAGDGKLLRGTGGIFELKIDFGPGYRVYFIRKGDQLFILLCGGDKGSQSADIAKAIKIARKIET